MDVGAVELSAHSILVHSDAPGSLPLAEQQVLACTQPLFLVLLSIPLPGERPPPQRRLAVALGFSGVLDVAVGGGLSQARSHDMPSWPVLLALAQGAVAAVTVIQVRQLSLTERSTTIALWQAILMLLHDRQRRRQAVAETGSA